MSDTTMPAWFAAWSATKFDTFAAEVREEFKQLSSRVSTLESDITVLRSRVDSLEVASVTQKDRALLTDSCEVLIAGIPKSFTGDQTSALQKVFEATDNLQNLNFISSCRLWRGRQASEASSTQGKEESISLVIKLISPIIRNDVVSRSRLLKGKSANSIFGVGGAQMVSLRPIWPQQTYKLFQLAISKSKDLNYLRPVVRNLVVCMRADASAPLFPIYSPDDFQSLKPNSSPQ